MPAFGGGACGSGLPTTRTALAPRDDKKTDTLILSNLKSDLEVYLEKRKKERETELTQTRGLIWLKNRIFHACSTLDEREEQIHRILRSKNSRELEWELLSCWRENSWDCGEPKGELAIIISKHWNQLNRMNKSEKQALDAMLSQDEDELKCIV